MEDVTVTMLDGTKVAKSQVPEGVVYINENGVKVRKVKKATPTAAQTPTTSKPANLFDNLKNIAGIKLPNILSSVNLDEGISKLKGLKGIDTKSLVDMLQNITGKTGGANGISNMVSGVAKNINVNQLRGATSSLNIPWLNNVLDTVEGMQPSATPKQQLASYLSIAMEDGTISDDEFAQLHKMAQTANVSDADLQAMIKARQN